MVAVGRTGESIGRDARGGGGRWARVRVGQAVVE